MSLVQAIVNQANKPLRFLKKTSAAHFPFCGKGTDSIATIFPNIRKSPNLADLCAAKMVA